MRNIRIEEMITGDELKGLLAVEISVIEILPMKIGGNDDEGRHTLCSAIGYGSNIELARTEAYRELAHELIELIP